MEQGFLSQYFKGVAVKRLSSVEVNLLSSNQHEFNGSRPLRNLLGDARLTNYPARFIWLGEENEGISEEGSVTWYDARESHPTRTEYRLYFRSNQVVNMAEVGDILIVAKRPNDDLYIFIIKNESTLENQLLWLFGIEQVDFNLIFQPIEDAVDIEVDFAVRYILEEMGIEIEESDVDYLDYILQPYLVTRSFPSTREFSTLARATLTGVSPLEDPDNSLIRWMEHEEKLFKRLERYIVAERLEQGFVQDNTTDVEGFIKFSLSVQNRRKSRVGYTLENHLEEIFILHDLHYSRTPVTEHNSKPDFLFPNIECYQNQGFPNEKLTMLGVKTTCKDRWRQIISEAARVETKHLFTLEPSISENQTSQMQVNNVQLVLPSTLHETYKPQQQSWLMNLDTFIQLAKSRQNYLYNF